MAKIAKAPTFEPLRSLKSGQKRAERERRLRYNAWMNQGKRCYWCQNILPIEKTTSDHYEAKVNGGRVLHPLNIVAACERCNNDKGEMHGNEIMDALLSGKSPKAFSGGLRAILRRRAQSTL